MPSGTHSSKHHSTPSLAWQVCAACGPLNEDFVLLAGLDLRGVDGVQEDQRCFEVTHPVSFTTLYRWVQENDELRALITRVEQVRSRGASRRPRPTHEELAARARAALLLGKERSFLQCFKLYADERCYVWHPDPQHIGFWESVLGPGWEGSEYLPAGAPRDEFVLNSAIVFALFPSPPNAVQGQGLHGAPAGVEWLEVAAALRAADATALEPMEREGSEAARAGREFLAGRLRTAQSAFERLFGRAEDNRYDIVGHFGLPLIVYALLCGVLSGASHRYVQAWFDYARHGMTFSFPWAQRGESEEIMRFLDHLEQVDNVVNRRGVMLLTPRFGGPLSRLPFAMFYPSLPAYVRNKVKLGPLVKAVEYFAQADMRLLAHLGASGLMQSGELDNGQRRRLQPLLAGSEVGELPPLPPPATERALAELREMSQKYARRDAITLQRPGAESPVLVASRSVEGVSICLEEGSERDNATLRRLRKLAGDGHLLLEGATPAELTRLFVSLQPHIDVVGSLAGPGETVIEASARPVLLLAHLQGGRCLAALRLRLLPGAEPLMSAGCGLQEPVLVGGDGNPVVVKRDTKAEWRAVENATRGLDEAGLPHAPQLLDDSIIIEDFTALAACLKHCRELGIEVCWMKGYALKLHQPQGGLCVRTGVIAGDWLELGGGLPVDEGRVLELSCLLTAFATREGHTLCLGEGEYVMLTPALERQLALLALVRQEKRGRLGASAAAIPLLAALQEQADSGTTTPSQLVPPAPVPRGLKASLRLYQEAGYRWLAERAEMGLGALLADDMGLGKTVQVLAMLLHAAERKDAGPSLVVAPVSLLENWVEEAARFAPSLQMCIYDPKKPLLPEGAGAGTVVLTSYGLIASRHEIFAAQQWDVFVLDEAQSIKNPDSQRARAVCTVPARVRFCLTGTPIENSLLDLWSQMRFLNPGLLGTRAAFMKRFKRAGDEDLVLLRKVLAPLVLRRTKDDVLQQLPPLTETIEWVSFSPEERALYESLRRSLLDLLERHRMQGGHVGLGVLAELTRLRRACCHGKLALPEFTGTSSKLAAMVDRVIELRAAGHRVLIFSQFTDVLDLAQAELQAAGITYFRLDGSTPVAQRGKLVREFQNGGADAFLISLKAGGTGLNLTAARYVLLLDPWWNPAVEAQAASRSHRMGQQHPVIVCRFMVRGTVEERILALHKEKKALADSILSGSGEGLNLQTLQELLEEGW